ncbi:MAG: tRNA (N(6)-L-threonylcarbamoyladenosine(37)-C(2))-methylthiotransferase [Nanoarchaeota archaeon]
MVKVHFITQGCSANVADSEVMMGLLRKEGFELVNNLEDSDVVIVNTCTVKSPSVSSFQRRLNELEQKYSDKKVIIAGCIPQSQLNDFKNYSKVGTYQIKRIVEAVEATLKCKVVSFLEREDEGRLNLPKVRKNEFIEIVTISQGCLNACTFCKTKHARGNLKSYSIKDIVRHISNAVDNNTKEIWLTSQDNSVYGLDIKTNLVELLKQILTIKKDFKIRVGMGNPKHMLPYLNDLINVMKNDKILKFIHVPLQAGSDKVLDDMKRGYSAEDFVKIVSAFRREIPEISIATDIICGFPTETEKDFEETMNVIRKTRPDMINYSRFWSRPGTPAAKMKQVDGKESKRRTIEVMNLFKKIAKENSQKWIGRTERILITEKGKNNTWIGKNDSYKQIIVKGDFKIGDEVNVKIKDASHLDLKGEIM